MNQTQSTQKFVDIKEIKDGVVHLRTGGLRQILIVSGVNFDLKSDEEQALILSGFQNFLNMLDFSVQIFIHSRKVNISQYLEKMNERKEKETSELLKIQIEDYIEFIRSFVEQNPIISKTFFVTVPYEPVAIVGQVKGLNEKLFSFFKKTKTPSSQKQETLQESLEQLNHRANQIIAGLEQVGLRAIPLNDEALIELFYNLYNPRLVEKKGLEIAKTK